MEDDYLSYGQALLLWSVIHLGCNNLVLAKMTLAQALILCSVKAPETCSHEAMFERRRGLALSGCFVMDALLSFATGTRPQMMIDDMPSCTPCDESGLDEWEPFVDRFEPSRSSASFGVSILAAPSRTSSTFNHLVKLLCILNTAMHRQTLATKLAADIEMWSSHLPSHLKKAGSVIYHDSPGNLLPPQLHLRAMSLFISSFVTSKQAHESPHTPSIDHQQGLEKEMAAVLLHFSHTFGVKALPPCVSVLFASLPAQSQFTAGGWSRGSASEHLSDTITGYKSLWGWCGVLPRLDGAARSQGYNHLPPAFLSYSPSNTALHDEQPHGVLTTTSPNSGAGQQNDRILIQNLLIPEQLNNSGIDLTDPVASAMFDSMNRSENGEVHIDTQEEQLREYLALLQQKQRYVICQCSKSQSANTS
jgi:hypothetical protein